MKKIDEDRQELIANGYKLLWEVEGPAPEVMDRTSTTVSCWTKSGAPEFFTDVLFVERIDCRDGKPYSSHIYIHGTPKLWDFSKGA
jgi:hypothetical protein